jgi:hypothetical protein
MQTKNKTWISSKNISLAYIPLVPFQFFFFSFQSDKFNRPPFSFFFFFFYFIFHYNKIKKYNKKMITTKND